jgi:plasmid stabilization system protein ParE
VRFRADARRDMLQATRWLKDIAADQARRFTDDAHTTAEALGAFPEAHPVLRGDARRVALGVFKYHLWYTIEDGTVWIVAVVHQSRGPDYLKRRIGKTQK